MVILEAKMAEALGNGFESCGLRPAVEILSNIGPMYNLRQKKDRRVFDAILRDDGLEASFTVVVA